LTKQSLAPPARQTTPEPTPDYVWRGRGLFEAYRDELEYVGGGCWLIPSGSDITKGYEVRVGSPRRPERSRCECVGFQHHNHCSHLICAELAHKKSAVCDGCGERKYWPQLREVYEDDGLLAWFPGDVLCDGCIGKGLWV
jgi:hypothetical protein